MLDHDVCMVNITWIRRTRESNNNIVYPSPGSVMRRPRINDDCRWALKVTERKLHYRPDILRFAWEGNLAEWISWVSRDRRFELLNCRVFMTFLAAFFYRRLRNEEIRMNYTNGYAVMIVRMPAGDMKVKLHSEGRIYFSDCSPVQRVGWRSLRVASRSKLIICTTNRRLY